VGHLLQDPIVEGTACMAMALLNLRALRNVLSPGLTPHARGGGVDTLTQCLAWPKGLSQHRNAEDLSLAGEALLQDIDYHMGV
jgi:hypothetical protein